MSDDRDLFRKSMRGVRRLDHDIAPPAKRRPAPIPSQRRRDDQAVIDELRNGEFDAREIETGDELLFLRSGLQRRVLRRLRRGEFTVEAELDLHGHTVERARAALNVFLMDAKSSHRHCVRIVHGKGLRSPGRRPVLRDKVARWLRQRADVLAFCTAPAADGGAGALYVLLKRR